MKVELLCVLRRAGERLRARLICGIVGCGTAVAALAVGVAPAAADTVSCGSVVTTSVTLTQDITGCTGDGLDVGASGITINLNGHTISGTNDVGPSGINDSGYNNVTIENGTVTGFDEDVFVQNDASGTKVRNIAATDGRSAGFAVNFGATGTVLANDTASSAVYQGVVLYQSSGTTIRHLVATGNGFDGINVIDTADTVLDRDVANGNSNAGVAVQQTASNANTGTVIEGLTANGNIGDGLAIFPGPTNTSVTSTRANDNTGDGIYAGSPSTTLTATVTNDNGGHGINAVPGVRATDAIAHGNKTPPECVNVTCL